MGYSGKGRCPAWFWSGCFWGWPFWSSRRSWHTPFRFFRWIGLIVWFGLIRGIQHISSTCWWSHTYVDTIQRKKDTFPSMFATKIRKNVGEMLEGCSLCYFWQITDRSVRLVRWNWRKRASQVRSFPIWLLPWRIGAIRGLWGIADCRFLLLRSFLIIK